MGSLREIFLKQTKCIHSMFDVGRSMFDVHRFLFRSNWLLQRPVALQKPDTRHLKLQKRNKNGIKVEGPDKRIFTTLYPIYTPPDNGGADTTGAQRFCSRRLMPFELNRFALVNRTVFIRFFKAAPQFAPGCTSSPAIADMFAIQAEFRREMGLFKQRGVNDGFFFIYQVIDG